MNQALRKISVGVLSAALLLGAGATVAKSGHGKHPAHEYRKYFNSEVLQLTDEQKSAIKEIREKARSEAKAERKSNQRVSIRSLNPSAPDYQAQVDAIAEAKAEMVKAKIKRHAEVRAQIYAVLTPEQQEKMLALDNYRTQGKGDKGSKHSKHG